MSDPNDLIEALAEAEDAFTYESGPPTFEPLINSGTDAGDGEVQIQKACRLIDVAHFLRDRGPYYTSILEHSFAAIERSLEGYLLFVGGYDRTDFHDHSTVYDRARRQAPLEKDTLDALGALYETRRTDHYYGSTVTTERQASSMLAVATTLHDHVVGFDTTLVRYCNCGREETYRGSDSH